MTVSSTTSRVSYAGNGSTVTFTVPYYFLSSSDLVVIKTSSTGVQTTLVLSTDYTVTGAGSPSGGSITCTTAPAGGETLVIFRDPAATQLTDYQANDPFPAETHERALDKLTMLVQRSKDLITRSFTLSDGDVSGASTQLPIPTANNVIGWNATATGLQNVTPQTLATIVSSGQTYADIFTGTGAQTNFTLSNNPGSLYNMDVSVGGVTQLPNTDYTWVSGTTLTFTTAPPNGAKVLVRYSQALLDGTTDSSSVNFLPAGTGASVRTVQSKLRDVVSVTDFGVLSTLAGAASANTAIFQAALDACETSGSVLMGVPGTFPINSTLVIKCSCDLSMMTLTIAAGASTVGIRVGPNVAGQYLFDETIALPFITNSAKSGAGWTGFTNSIGVEVANVYQSRITVPSIYNFGVGLSCGGYGVGCVYNTFTLGVLFGNRINLQLLPKTTAGWCNQNTFIGGRLAYNSAEGTNVAGVIQIQLRHQAGATNGAPNNNVFLNSSIEGNEPQFHLDIQGAFNQWIAPRFEVATATPGRVNFYAETVGETSDNNLIGGYDAGSITYTFSGAGTAVRNKRIGGNSSDSFEYSGNGVNYNNKSGNSRAAPHIQGFLSSQSAIAKTNSSTDWIYRLHGDGLSIKSSGDSFDRVAIDAAGYAYFGRGGASPTNFIRGGSPAGYGLIVGGGILYPDADNTRTLGDASFRWSVVYAGTGTINTSDEREKQDIATLDAAEKRVATALKGLVKKFRFKDAVQAKGENARIHVGVIAQEVIAAFQAENLNPMRYGIVCYDQWDAQPEELGADGNVLTPARPAGNRYGVRYEELLAFIIAAL